MRARIFAVALAVIATAVALAWANRPSPPLAVRADYVLVEKSAHRLTLYHRGHPIAWYRIALGRGGLAAKHQAGDGLTPEGHYIIDRHLERSAFHKALHLSYPSPQQVAEARAAHIDPGGAIMIHGLRNRLGWIGRLHRIIDWTNGCIAVTDTEMDILWQAIKDGTPVDIRR